MAERPVLDEVTVQQYTQYPTGLDPSVYAFYSQLSSDFITQIPTINFHPDDAPPPGPQRPRTQDPLQHCYAMSDGTDAQLRACDIDSQINAYEPSKTFVLPEVPVNAPKITVPVQPLLPPPAPPPPMPLLPQVVTLVGRLIGGAATLLFPTPMGPRELDEAPDPLPELPEVLVSQPPRRPPRVIDTPLDPILPPNWSDLLDFRPPGPTTPGIPFPVFSPIPFLPLDPLPLELEPFDEPLRVPLPDPRYRPTPGDRSAPGRVADPYRDPLRFPFDVLDPFGDIAGYPSPDLRPYPIGDPGLFPAPDRTAFPVPSDPIALPPRPGAPGPGPAIPDLITPFDPRTPLMPDPFAFPQPLQPNFADKDPCNCPPQKKDKKRKKPTDRVVCYKGTYKQNTRGITFMPQEEVPCEKKGARAKLPKRGDEFDSLQDLAGSIFGTSNLSPFGR